MGLYGAVLTVLGTKGVGAGCGWISGLLVADITLKQEVITEKIAFFDVKFNDIFKGKSIKANVILNSKRNLINYNSVSLEHLRERNLDKIWRENMNFKD